MYIPEYKTFMVHINRTGGTSIERAFSQQEYDHTTPIEYIQQYGWSTWNNYFKFCFVRNPWDRLVSIYENRRIHEELVLSFSEWLEEIIDKWWVLQVNWISDQRRNIMVDFIGRFENLNEDFKYICKKIDVSLKLPWVNKIDKIHYLNYYSQKDFNLVNSFCKRDIKEFGYKPFKLL